MMTMQVGRHSFIDPEPYTPLLGEINDTLDTAIETYSRALVAYQASIPAAQLAARRQQDAQREWEKAVAEAIASGRTIEEIHAKVGEVFPYMTNPYATAVGKIACEMALQAQETLKALLATFNDEVTAFFKADLEARGVAR